VKSRTAIQVATYSAALLVGFLLAKVIRDVPLFEMDRKVNPVTLAGLIATVLASLVLFRRFDQIKYSDQLRKKAVVDRLEHVFTHVADLEELTDNDSIPHLEAVKSSTKIRKEFRTYLGFAAALSSPVPEDTAKAYELVCADVKDLLTNTPHKGDPQPGLHIVDGNIELTPGRKVEVQRKLDEARDILHGIQKSVILSLR
jgi:hypothetical protein